MSLRLPRHSRLLLSARCLCPRPRSPSLLPVMSRALSSPSDAEHSSDGVMEHADGSSGSLASTAFTDSSGAMSPSAASSASSSPGSPPLPMQGKLLPSLSHGTPAASSFLHSLGAKLTGKRGALASQAISPSASSASAAAADAAFASPAGLDLSKLSLPSLSPPRPLCVLLAVGSYSPVTTMHLQLFETARDHLMYSTQQLDVVGGIISPVHDAYGKPSLVAAEHRLEMCRRACDSSDWIATSGWETLQAGWTTTAATMQAYAAFIAAAYPQLQPHRPPPRLLLLCGADLLESFLVPGLWHPDDLSCILGQHGVAVIERVGLELQQLLASSPLLSRHRSGIHIVPQRVINNVSSTIVRENVSRGLSIAYLVPASVAAYIHSRALYGHDQHRESMRRPRRAIQRSSSGTGHSGHWKGAELLAEAEAESEADELRRRPALNGAHGEAGNATTSAYEKG